MVRNYSPSELKTLKSHRSRAFPRELPSHTVLFLSNLPKSVVAFPFYSLEQVISLIEAIYDDKFVSDRADEADGVAREELVRQATPICFVELNALIADFYLFSCFY